MSTKSLSVAQSILDRCAASNRPITPMALIKLVYVAHGYMLAKKQRSLLDESVEAWKYGPVVPDVYHAVKNYKSSPITPPIVTPEAATPLHEDEIEIINLVADTYGKYDGITLSAATHQPGTPWKQTWDKWGQNWTIPNELIASFYSTILSQPKHSSL